MTKPSTEERVLPHRLRPRAREGLRPRVARRPLRATGRPGEYPFTRGLHATGYRGRLWTMRQYAGFGSAAESQPPLPLPARAGHDRPLRRLRPADADRLRLGRPARPRRGRARSGWRSTASRTWSCSSTEIPLDRVSTSMTINATAAILLALYVAVARRRGHPRAGPLGHRAERHPEGVRGARDLDLPARALDAPGDGPLRVLRRAHPEVEHDLDLGLPHPRGGRDRAPGDRLHLRERARVRAGREGAPGSTPSASASGSPSSSPATRTSSRRSPSSAARGGCGRGS